MRHLWRSSFNLWFAKLRHLLSQSKSHDHDLITCGFPPLQRSLYLFNGFESSLVRYVVSYIVIGHLNSWGFGFRTHNWKPFNLLLNHRNRNISKFKFLKWWWFQVHLCIRHFPSRFAWELPNIGNNISRCLISLDGLTEKNPKITIAKKGLLGEATKKTCR